MLNIQSFTEMNQAVPGSFVSSRPPMESPLECEVPSPSQLSDPCRSPPSLHSPPHYPPDLDKFKEEPFSPISSFYSVLTPSPPLYLHGGSSSPHSSSFMSRDGPTEPSMNLAEVLAEKDALVQLVQQQRRRGHQQESHEPLRDQQLLHLQQIFPPEGPPSVVVSPPVATPFLLHQDNKDAFSQLAFLDSLVDVKRELIVEPEASSLQQSVSVSSSPSPQPSSSIQFSSCPSPSSSISSLRSPPAAATGGALHSHHQHLLLSPGGAGGPAPSTVAPTQAAAPSSSSGGDFLKNTVEMALDHYTQDFQRVSNKLGIPLDPSSWSAENVRCWLSFQADLLGDLPPLHLEHFNLPGKELMNLTEAQFRLLFPRGGDIFYAKLEIWKEAITKSTALLFQPLVTMAASSTELHYQTPLIHPTIVYQQHIPQHSQSEAQPMFVIGQKTSAPIDKEVKISTSAEYLQQTFHSHTYQTSPSQHNNYKPPETLASLLSPTPRILTTTPLQYTESPSSSTISVSQSHISLPVTSAHIPTVVLQAGVQTSTVHTQQEASSTTSHTSLLQTIKTEEDTHHQLSSHTSLEESSLDVLMQGDLPTTSTPPHQTALNPQKETANSDDEADADTASSGTTTGTRSGTHIHLWQFLKELLQQPQHYGSCIRWLDRQKGIFKIEDSVRVARLWGKRKNRPAMNYDKLSRSIRQYYKKGIMKKTERSQRLVYQFCHPYSL